MPFNILGYIPRIGIAGLNGNPMLNFLRNCHPIPICPHPWQCLLLSVFFIIAVPVGEKWYLTAALICIFPMSADVGHLFMYLLTIKWFS